jgi:hypothetical protein
MTREAIQLNPDKVKLHIACSGLHIKQLLDGMNAKTVHRIKAGKNTTYATAHKLATKLGVAVDDLISPVKPDDMNGFLPEQWLYDQAAPSGNPPRQIPFWMLIGGGFYCIDQPPVNMCSPVEKLFKHFESTNQKIVLRQDDQAFVIELHYFDYSPDHAQTVVYNLATACRLFPLARNGDTFSKTGLDDLLRQYVWNSLKEKALASAEIVSIEGHDYPDDPRVYFPLVRFSRGIGIRRMSLGSRTFVSQYDLRESLLEYLKNVPTHRIHATPTETGIAVTVEPARPAIFSLDWRHDVLEFKVNLAWRTPDGNLALAPWRQASREKFITGIKSRNWQDMHMQHMPLRFFSQYEADEDSVPPPFDADPSLSAESLAAINARDYTALF